MFSFTITTFINRPPQEVYNFVSNPANAVQWRNGEVSSKYTSEGPARVGSTFQSVGRAMGRDLIVDAEITQLNQPHVWAFKASSGPMKFEETGKFESKDDGTLLVRSFNAEIGGFFKIAEGLAIKQLQKQIEADSNTLKALLEAK